MTDGAPRNGPAEPPKLRVAYVDHVAQLSGGEIALMRLLDTLEEVDAHVILAEDGPLVTRLSAAGVSVEVLPMRERTRDLQLGSHKRDAMAATGTHAHHLFNPP